MRRGDRVADVAEETVTNAERIVSDMARVRVVVLFGGQSSEHAISCVSAGSVMRALDPARYEVIPVGSTVDGRWVRVDGDPEQLVIHDGHLPAVDAAGVQVALQPTTTEAVLADIQSEAVESIDVVFPVLHGPWGEDGTVQGLLELAGVPYVGSGVFASAAGMDKGHMKRLIVGAGIPTGPFEIITDRAWRDDPAECLRRSQMLADPPGRALFVKPARAGSSVGISRVTDLGELAAAIEFARHHDPKVIVEAAIDGAREVECGVLVIDGVPQASVCAEIVLRSGHDFYDFDAKYLDDAVDLVVPAELPADVESRVQQLAVETFEALGCEGLARVDFFVLPDGSVVLNEINTMPGFTSISMFPRMWAASGLSYPALIDALIADALRRGTGLR